MSWQVNECRDASLQTLSLTPHHHHHQYLNHRQDQHHHDPFTTTTITPLGRSVVERQARSCVFLPFIRISLFSFPPQPSPSLTLSFPSLSIISRPFYSSHHHVFSIFSSTLLQPSRLVASPVCYDRHLSLGFGHTFPDLKRVFSLSPRRVPGSGRHLALPQRNVLPRRQVRLRGGTHESRHHGRSVDLNALGHSRPNHRRLPELREGGAGVLLLTGGRGLVRRVV